MEVVGKPSLGDLEPHALGRAPLPSRLVLTSLSLSSPFYEMGSRIVWITNQIHGLCGLNENARGLPEAWHEVLHKWHHLKTKSMIILWSHQLSETNSETFIFAI